MDSARDVKQRIIEAGHKAVNELIKVAEEKIITNTDDDLEADKLKNAAATKKLAIFDAFEILTRIEYEKAMLDDSSSAARTKNMTSFAEKRAK